MNYINTKTRYRPIYMPATDNEELLKDHPLFDTEEEALDYIHKKYCQCHFKDKKEDYCLSCEAEWFVEKIEENQDLIIGLYIGLVIGCVLTVLFEFILNL